jgi:uncharacterized protein (DUF2062 family)
MAPFRHLLHDHRLWGIRRKTVVPAFAIGLFVMWMPWPGHMVISSIIALFLRVNVPVAFFTTLISNPLTMPPMYLLTYSLGAWLLGMPVVPPDFDASLDWALNTLVDIWQPLMLGGVLLGTASSLLGLVTLDLLWRASIARYKDRKRSKRQR